MAEKVAWLSMALRAHSAFRSRSDNRADCNRSAKTGPSDLMDLIVVEQEADLHAAATPPIIHFHIAADYIFSGRLSAAALRPSDRRRSRDGGRSWSGLSPQAMALDDAGSLRRCRLPPARSGEDMGLARQWNIRAFILAGAILALALVLMWPPASGSTPFVMTTVHQDPRLSVMTYNVEGLPFPARFGRGADLRRIGAQLQAMRIRGDQPHIVALQEVFSDDAHKIAVDAGYRYVADGPSSDLAGVPAIRPADRAFVEAGNILRGENSGKLVGSGLQILSDYPILAIKRIAFPAYACAGYDCLANKGAVIAFIAVPGLKQPLAIVDVHLNSRKASGVSDARSLYAYRRQIDTLDDFLSAGIRPGDPMIMAGDLNVGSREARLAYFRAHLVKWAENSPAPISDALRSCSSQASLCARHMSNDAMKAIDRARDWQLALSGHDISFGVTEIAVPFGHDVNGLMLSDHVGYIAYYSTIAAT